MTVLYCARYTRIIHSRWCCNLYITSYGFYCSWICNCITTTTILWPLFPDHLGEPVPKENFWTLWCKEGLTEADTLTIRMGATPSRLTSAQPTVSKHWRQSAIAMQCKYIPGIGAMGGAGGSRFILQFDWLQQIMATVSKLWQNNIPSNEL